MHGCTDSSDMKYKKFKNLNYIYWVSLNRVLKLFNKVQYMYTKKKKIAALHYLNALEQATPKQAFNGRKAPRFLPILKFSFMHGGISCLDSELVLNALYW